MLSPGTVFSPLLLVWGQEAGTAVYFSSPTGGGGRLHVPPSIIPVTREKGALSKPLGKIETN